MIEEIQKPEEKPEETISDEQLENIVGGTFDNNRCTAAKATWFSAFGSTNIGRWLE